jgi:putative ABC transport system permease protein
MNRQLFIREIARRFSRYKIKSLLMLAGIMLGVFTLTTGMAGATGFKANVLVYFDKIFLPGSITLAARTDMLNARLLTEDDISAVLRELPAITAWTPLVPGGRVDLVRQGNSRRAGLSGTGVAAPLVTGQGVLAGDYFSEEDVRTRARVALLGTTVQEELFGSESPLGQPLTIGTQVFTIKGVLESLGADPHGGDLDNVVVIPYSTLLQMNKWDSLVSVRFRVADYAAVAGTGAALQELLRRQHNITPGREDDFYVGTAPAGQQSFQEFERMFNMLLPVVVGIILALSALVIASIMLISVKERTAEIGLRKAVGARAQDVQLQFLGEVLLLAFIGGALGTALSYAPLVYVQQQFALAGSAASFLPSPTLLLISFACALLTGTLAAWWPARKAAALAPADALR